MFSELKNKITSGYKLREILNIVDEMYFRFYEEKLPILLNLKYHAIANAEQSLGDVERIRSMFFSFQRNLYAKATGGVRA